MPEGGGEVGHVLTAKVGPLPLILWVVGGSGVILIFMLMKNKGSSGAQGVQTNQVSALAPTEAEAFGTLEQQQQDVVNALTTLGNNQSALGGSMSTLTGIVTQQGSDNAASFQNLKDGQNTIEQGQATAASTADRYNTTLLAQLANYFGSMGSQINGVNSNVTAQGTSNANLINQIYAALSGQVAGVGNQVAGVGNQVAGVSGQVAGTQTSINQMGNFLGWQFYQLPNRYTPMIPNTLNPPGFQ